MMILLPSLVILLLALTFYGRSRIIKVRRELVQVREQLERGLMVANMGVWEYDISSKKLYWSDTIYHITEQDRERTTPTREAFWDLIHPEDREMVLEKQKESLNTRRKTEIIHRILMKDGRVKWIEEHLKTEFDKSGNPVKSVGTIYDFTRQKEGELIFKSLLENASDGIHILDEKGNLLYYSRSFARSLGYEYDELENKNITDWEANLDKDQIRATIKLLLKSDITFETKHRKKDGTLFDVQISATDILLDGKKRIYASQRDISEQKHYIEQLNKLNIMLNTAAKVGKIGFWELDGISGKVEWNEALYDIFEVDDKTSPMDRERFLTFLPPEKKDDLIHKFMLFQKRGDYSVVHDIITEKGNRKIVDERGRHFYDGEGRLIKTVGSVMDITERIARERIIKKQAVTDELTQLGNRKAYNERLSELIAQYKRYHLIFSLLIFDIDLFKDINDTYGHHVGDQVLMALGKLVSSLVRKNDFIFRIGGEEFVILMSGTDMEHAILLAEKVRRAIEKDLNVISNRDVTVSIGVGEMERDDTADSLFRKADKNLYLAKRSGRNRVVGDLYSFPAKGATHTQS